MLHHQSSNSLVDSLLRPHGCMNRGTTIAAVGGGGKTTTLFTFANELKSLGFRVCISTTTHMMLPTNEQTDDCFAVPEPTQLALKPANASISFLYKHSISDHSEPNPKVKGFSTPELLCIQKKELFDFYLIEADGSKHCSLKAPARHEPCIPPFSDVVLNVCGAELLLRPAQASRIHRWSEFSTLCQCKEGQLIDADVLYGLLSDPDGGFKATPDRAKRIWLINKMDLALDPQMIQDLAQQLMNRLNRLDGVALTELTEQKQTQVSFFIRSGS